MGTFLSVTVISGSTLQAPPDTHTFIHRCAFGHIYTCQHSTLSWQPADCIRMLLWTEHTQTAKALVVIYTECQCVCSFVEDHIRQEQQSNGAHAIVTLQNTLNQIAHSNTLCLKE